MSYIIINKSVSPYIILTTNGDCSGLVCPASGAAAALLVCCPYCSTLSSDTICGVIKHWWWLECCGGPQSHCSLSPTAASVPLQPQSHITGAFLLTVLINLAIPKLLPAVWAAATLSLLFFMPSLHCQFHAH